MANVFNLLKEALKDNEPNEEIEATLNKMLNNQAESFLSEYTMNMQFMMIMIENAIDKRSNYVNETELRHRAKLMSKLMVRDSFLYYLYFLTNIISMCFNRNIKLGKINAIMEILQQESVITPFAYSHWHTVFIDPSNSSDDNIVQQRFNALNMCITFLNKMEDDPHDPEA